MPANRADLVAIFTDAAPILGLSRPAAQCLAAVWRAPSPPDAEALMAACGLSRSAVSTALKELREAGYVLAERLPGTRRDGFSAPADSWALLRQHLSLRLRRELLPLLDRLHALPEDEGAADLAAMLGILATWLERLVQQDPGALLAGFSGNDAAPRVKKKKKKG